MCTKNASSSGTSSGIAENIDVHCDWWEGRDRRRVDEDEADFQNLWEGDPKSLRIIPLPEAVQKLCTDASAEDLNLQTADMLINFDLGWNPIKIEQRIGRIDRIGQRHPEIFVVNLCYAGSEEEVVYGRLLQRLQQANLVVGSANVPVASAAG
ncbi:hypothetical protein CVV65_14305 [Kyrpidia spormannii]|uniref:Helicase C-terminal domain-containing protein n=2 Tax=Kyrpidia spormannii TaxID=2055160 RepID=A0A2K8N9C4_9BACL|nr:hypothetical protein CVV65_14305 [Kyrpidia spormannii]